MKTQCIALAVLLTASLPAAGGDALVPGSESAQAVNTFALKLLNSVTNRSENFVLSPFGIHMVLSMAREGAGGGTRREIDDALAVPEGIDYGENYNQLLNRLRTVVTNGQSELRMASSIWTQEDVFIDEKYREALKGSFLSAIENADFRNLPGQAAADINAWVSRRTGGRITKIASREAFNNNTVAALVSAVYFKGAWTEPFKYSKTRTGKFLLPDMKKAEVYYMRQTERVDYGFDEHVELLSKQYVGRDLEIMFVVPRRIGVFTGEGERITTEKIAKWIHLLQTRETEVYLPKFKFGTMVDITGLLKKLGVKEAFDAEKADFSAMGASLFLDRAVHAAEIEVEEKGTTASSATMAVAAFGDAPERPPVFAADRPFLFFIRERFTGLILFMGYVANPNQR